jgi:hypothetical protein
MTSKTKKIVGVVVVLGVLYYLYDRNKKMKAKEELVAGADVTPAPVVAPEVTTPPIVKTTATLGQAEQLNFAGSNKRGISAQYFR